MKINKLLLPLFAAMTLVLFLGCPSPTTPDNGGGGGDGGGTPPGGGGNYQEKDFYGTWEITPDADSYPIIIELAEDGKGTAKEFGGEPSEITWKLDTIEGIKVDTNGIPLDTDGNLTKDSTKFVPADVKGIVLTFSEEDEEETLNFQIVTLGNEFGLADPETLDIYASKAAPGSNYKQLSLESDLSGTWKTENNAAKVEEYILNSDKTAVWQISGINEWGFPGWIKHEGKWSVIKGMDSTNEKPTFDLEIKSKDDTVETWIHLSSVTTGKNDDSYVYKNIPVTGVVLNKTKLDLQTDASETLEAFFIPRNTTSTYVSWESNDTETATVLAIDYTVAKVTGLTAGTATITAKTANGDITATCQVTVTTPDPLKVASVTLDPKPTYSFNQGDEIEFTATILPETAENQNITWTSSNELVAIIYDSFENYGIIQPLSSGKTTITVTTVDGGKTDTYELTVK